MAEVLLRVFFRTTIFTKKIESEWVYSEHTDAVSPSSRKARLVCVKDAERARYWLAKWGELDLGQSVLGFQSWYRNWAEILGGSQPSRGLKGQDPQTALERASQAFAPGTGGSEVLDNDAAAPVRMTTVVLLDLRLEKKGLGPIYAVRDLPSVRLRAEIKEQKPSLPVIIYTASRQAMNFAEIMEDATELDGWLCKEAPDMKEDDQNSKRAFQYLLARVHLFAAASAWYREELKWEPNAKIAYGNMFDSEYRDPCLRYVGQKATELFQMVKDDKFGVEIEATRKAFLGFIQEKVQFPQFSDVIAILIARRVAVGTLLHTARVEKGVMQWSGSEFITCLRGGYWAKMAKDDAPYRAVNFRRECWLGRHEPDKLINLLLTEEVEWLRNQEWPRNRENIKQWSGTAQAAIDQTASGTSRATLKTTAEGTHAADATRKSVKAKKEIAMLHDNSLIRSRKKKATKSRTMAARHSSTRK
jgi:hypothetical protein